MSVKMNEHADRIIIVYTACIHGSYHMTSQHITRENFGKKVRALLKREHVNELSRLRRHQITDLVILDVDTPRPLKIH